MRNTQKQESGSNNLRCTVCTSPIESSTTVATRSGAKRVLSAVPGELTECERCHAMLEYGGRPGALTLHRARPDRVQSLRELEKEGPNEPGLPALVAYVMRYRTMPRNTVEGRAGTTRFTFFLRS